MRGAGSASFRSGRCDGRVRMEGAAQTLSTAPEVVSGYLGDAASGMARLIARSARDCMLAWGTDAASACVPATHGALAPFSPFPGFKACRLTKS